MCFCFYKKNIFCKQISFYSQAGPLERVSIPKDNGKNRQYGFVTFKYECSVPYAMSIFAGTKLFNRELRLNNRMVNRNNNNNNTTNESNQSRGQSAHVPPPVLPNIPLTHQFQLQNPMQNPFRNDALRGIGDNNQLRNSMNNMLPSAPVQQLQFPPNSQLDFAVLLAQSAQMLSYGNGLGANNGGNGDGGNDSKKHQSKIMHRHEHRSHNQNSNYSRDRDRRKNDSRSKSPDRNDWIRNKGRDNRSGRHDRDRDRNQRSDNNRRRNDRR